MLYDEFKAGGRTANILSERHMELECTDLQAKAIYGSFIKLSLAYLTTYAFKYDSVEARYAFFFGYNNANCFCVIKHTLSILMHFNLSSKRLDLTAFTICSY